MVATISLALEVKLSNWNEGWHSVYRGRLKGFARGLRATRSGYGHGVACWRCRVCVRSGAKIRCQRVLKMSLNPRLDNRLRTVYIHP